MKMEVTSVNKREIARKRKIESIDSLRVFFSDLLVRADHHAKQIEEVAPIIMGALVAYTVSDINVRLNSLWFRTSKSSYYLTYNHELCTIQLKNRNQKGDLISEFDNASSTQSVMDCFKSL